MPAKNWQLTTGNWNFLTMNHSKLTAQQIRNFLPTVPFAKLLGIKLTRVHRDGVTIECPLRRKLTNSAGVAHGGVAAALSDAAVGMAIGRHFGGKRPITTVEMKINYFLPATEGRGLGTALVTYMLLDARGTKGPA